MDIRKQEKAYAYTGALKDNDTKDGHRIDPKMRKVHVKAISQRHLGIDPKARERRR